MMDAGADWLHMGALLCFAPQSYIFALIRLAHYRRHGRSLCAQPRPRCVRLRTSKGLLILTRTVCRLFRCATPQLGAQGCAGYLYGRECRSMHAGTMLTSCAPLQCHMMVTEPGRVRLGCQVPAAWRCADFDLQQWVKDIAEAGGSSYTFHLEAACESSREEVVGRQVLIGAPSSDDPMEVVKRIKAEKMRAAVAINPGTPTSEISNELGEAVDMILVMTVWPGYGGQKFMKECMPKVCVSQRRRVWARTLCADAGAIEGRRASSPVPRSGH